MAYCKVCNEELVEGCKFCVRCGASIEGQTKRSYSIEKNESKKKSKKMWIGLISIGMVAVILAIAIALLNLNVMRTDEKPRELTEIDPFEYLDVEFSGYSGVGNIIISKNDKLKVINELDFSVDKGEKLSNGDIVIISLDDNAKDRALRHGYKLSCTNKEYTVAGLQINYETLKEDINSLIYMLVSNYIEAAYVKADLESIKMFVDDVSNINIESYKSRQKYIEQYENIECYTMETNILNAYMVYVTYSAKLYNIETMAPSAEICIIIYDENEEKYYIHNLLGSEKLSDYLSETNTAVVSELNAKVEKDLLEALNKDCELRMVYEIMQGTAKGSN